jgi:hypothetical protein
VGAGRLHQQAQIGEVTASAAARRAARGRGEPGLLELAPQIVRPCALFGRVADRPRAMVAEQAIRCFAQQALGFVHGAYLSPSPLAMTPRMISLVPPRIVYDGP